MAIAQQSHCTDKKGERNRTPLSKLHPDNRGLSRRVALSLIHPVQDTRAS